MSMHWILVCDAAGAKIYEGDALLEELTLVEEVSTESLATPGPEAVEAEQDPHRIDEDRLARTVAEVLNAGAEQHLFERLILVAPARLLGNLRMVLSPDAERRVVASVHHDWTKVPLHALAPQVRAHLSDSAGMP